LLVTNATGQVLIGDDGQPILGETRSEINTAVKEHKNDE
jgi:hypothetical protein